MTPLKSADTTISLSIAQSHRLIQEKHLWSTVVHHILFSLRVAPPAQAPPHGEPEKWIAEDAVSDRRSVKLPERTL